MFYKMNNKCLQKYDSLQILDILLILHVLRFKILPKNFFSSLFISYHIVHKRDLKERKFAHAN